MPDKPQKNTENQSFWEKNGSICIKPRKFFLQSDGCFTYKHSKSNGQSACGGIADAEDFSQS
jgi:hypothetical protein